MTIRSSQNSQRQTPAISIIVPVYNVDSHLIACLKSIQKQTWTDFEVIVVDDGSTDGSGHLAAEFCETDARFRFVTQANKGLSGARNTGLDCAKAEVISFVDSDDRIAPDFLEHLYRALLETGCDWVACGVKSCYPDGNYTSHSAIHGASDFLEAAVPHRYRFNNWQQVIWHFPSAWNKLYRRSLIDGLRFDEGTWFEDHSFFERAAARTDHLLHLPRALYWQTRGRNGQITASDSDRVFEQLDVLRRLRGIMEQGPFDDAADAYEQISSRLLFERSHSLRNPKRRARFAKAAAQFLRHEGLAYTTDWDDDIALSWGLEMNGELPLTICIECNSDASKDLQNTLDSVSQLIGPGFETILLCRSEAIAQMVAARHPDMPVLDLSTILAEKVWLRMQGRFVVILRAGVLLKPASLFQLVEQMLRHDAQMSLSAYTVPTSKVGEPEYRVGFADMRAFGSKPLEKGLLPMNGAAVLSLSPELSARVFDRRFLIDHKLSFTAPQRSGWALQLAAAALAPRVVYEPWAGISVPLEQVEPGSIGKSHDALVHALPVAVQHQLPKGWQRRLLDRAILTIQPHKAELNTLRKSQFYVGLIWVAMRRGLIGGRPDVASFDQPLSPSRERVFDPVSHIAALLGRSRSRPLACRQKELDVRMAMRRDKDKNGNVWLFPAAGSSAFSCSADFSHAPYANLSFLADDCLTVPVHFSFRRDENRVVFNREDNDGWGREQAWPYSFSKSVLELSIVIVGPTLSLSIDGEEVCTVTLDAQFVQSDADRRAFSSIEIQGAVRPLELVLEQPSSSLTLDKRLMLQAAHDSEAHHIRELTTNTKIPVTTLACLTQTPSLQALLPARLWKGMPENEDTELRLQVETLDGNLVGSTLRISQSDMVERLRALLLQQPTFADSTLVLTILEHVVHGKLYSKLSLTEQRAVDAITSHFGLADFVHGEDKLIVPPQSLDADSTWEHKGPKTDPVSQEVDLALAYLASSLEKPDVQTPLDAVANMPVSTYAAQQVYLAMSEVFVRHDQDFEAFFKLAKTEGVQPYFPNGDVWHDSVVLPFLFLQGDIDAVLATLRILARSQNGSISTVSIAWVLRKSLTSAELSERHREHLIYLWCALVTRRASDFWEPIHCHELTLAVVEIFAHFNALPIRQRRYVHRFCLRNYGLSRRFWAQLEQRFGKELTKELELARGHFNKVLNYKKDPTIAHNALMFFDTHDCADVPRLRRELFGPAGVPLPENTSPQLAVLQEAHTDPGIVALRHFASPGAAEPSGRLADLVATRLPEISNDQPRSPLTDIQKQTAEEIASVLAAPERRLDQAQFDALMDRCTKLADARSNFIGVALQVVLAGCFGKSNSNSAWVAQVLLRIRNISEALIDTEKKAISKSLPVRMVLETSRRDGAIPDAIHELETLLLGETLRVSQSRTDQDDNLSGSPLYDAIVTVFSCKPHLETRIPALREGWLQLLKGLGVPYIVIVGDGDGRQHGDVVYLDAPDTYEGLPQKTLAAIEWVYRTTDFAHMVKIDDDCFLNAPLFFQSLAYRKFDYYGRKLTRSVGQLNRVWHQQKSTSSRGQMELDKSPEPSTYADGGSGYSLSRRAMKEALATAQTAAGQHLIQISFMEDKLLGDLLALRGIFVADEDYTVTVRRRAHKQAIPVPSWQNGFDASRSAPVHLVHMDAVAEQREAVERLDTFEVSPKKIWPSYQPVRLGYQSNALELISPVSRVSQARQANVAVVACMRNEMFMLPHFLAHYRKLGVKAFLIADNSSDDGTLEYLVAQPDVTVFSVDTDYRLARYGVAWQQALLAEYRVNKWSLVADADELLVWQENQTQTLPELLSNPAFNQAEAVRLFMLDLYPKGPLDNATFTGSPFDEASYCDRAPFLTATPYKGPFSDQATWTSGLRHRLIPGSRPNLFVAQKLALLRYQPWMRLAAGMHYIGDARVASRELVLAHFKYNANFRRKAQTEVARGQHFNNAEEYQKYLALSSEGRSVIFDPDISMRWTQTSFARSIFSPES